MNIAISFVGEGLGHASRILTIAKELSKKHNIFICCPKNVQKDILHNFSSARSILKNKELIPIPNLRLIKKDHNIKVLKSTVHNWNLLFNNEMINKLAKKIKKLNIQAIISDYEPFLPKVGKKLSLPVLLFNHQGVINKHFSPSYDYFIARIANHYMMPYKTELITSSFYNGDVGPIIRDEVKQLKTSNKNFILVYLKPSFKKVVAKQLKSLPIPTRIFPNKKENFLEALASCSGVIAPAGHQLICECLYLKKPILVIPEKYQYEQHLNAIKLKASGKGMYTSLDAVFEHVEDFPDLLKKRKTSDDKFILTDDTPRAIKKIEKFLNTYK